MSQPVEGFGPPPSVVSVILGTHRMLIAIAAFILFEYVITLREEITVIWQRKWSLTSSLLLFIRWTLLIEAIFILLPEPDMESCSPRTIMILVPVLMGSVQTAAFSALRVFALWNHNYPIAVAVFVLGLAPVSFNSWVLVQNGAPLAFAGKGFFLCNQSRLLAGTLNHVYALVSRLPVVVAEMIVLILTWRKTYRSYRDSWRVGISTSLTGCLLRDGSLYFAALALINIAEIALIFHPSSISGITEFLDVIPLVLTARFILNIRSAAFDPDNYGGSTTAAAPSREAFARRTPVYKSAIMTAVDDLGEPLDIEEDTVSRAESQRGFRESEQIQMSTVVYTTYEAI